MKSEDDKIKELLTNITESNNNIRRHLYDIEEGTKVLLSKLSSNQRKLDKTNETNSLLEKENKRLKAEIVKLSESKQW